MQGADVRFSGTRRTEDAMSFTAGGTHSCGNVATFFETAVGDDNQQTAQYGINEVGK